MTPGVNEETVDGMSLEDGAQHCVLEIIHECPPLRGGPTVTRKSRRRSRYTLWLHRVAGGGGRW